MKPTRRSVVSLLTLYFYLSHLACLGGGGPSDVVGDNGDASRPSYSSSRQDALLPTKPPLRSLAIGDALRASPASFDVTPNGTATWSMPLWTPPGRNGIEPHLSVTYDSKRGSGWLGLGFAITGFSSITRCWKTPAQDGAFSLGPIPDEYCLDGERLVQRASINGLITFTPEFTPGTRVQITGAGTRQEPTAFEVRTSDGRIHHYGSREAANSRVEARADLITPIDPGDDSETVPFGGPLRALAWNVDAVEDRWGNFMWYDYSRTISPDGVEVLPRSIQWTGHGSDAPQRRLEFTFGEDRVDPRTGYQAGVRVRAGRRLTRVDVLGPDRLTSDEAVGRSHALRKYLFSYENVGAGTRALDRLAQVQECVTSSPGTTDAWACLHPYTFSWQGRANTITPRFVRTEPPGASQWSVRIGDAPGTRTPNSVLATEAVDLSVGDFNGDGRDDIAFRKPLVDGRLDVIYDPTHSLNEIPASIGTWSHSLGSATGLQAPMPSGLPNMAVGDANRSPRVLDVDNDGKAELVVPVELVGKLEQVNYYKLSGTSGFAELTSLRQMRLPPSFAIQSFFLPPRGLDFLAGDLGGDGPIDALVTGELVFNPFEGLPLGPPDLPNPTKGLWLRGGAVGGGFSPAKLVKQAGTGNVVGVSAGEDRFVLDVDGNGQPDILTETLPFVGSVRYSALTLVPSGSGADVVVRATNLHGSPAYGFVMQRILGKPVGQTTVQADPGTEFVHWFADVNGDGLPDSLAIAAVEQVNVVSGNFREHQNISFPVVSLNVGGEFRTATGQRLSRPHAPGPSVSAIPGSGSGASDVSRRIDPGIRIVDVDGDGRDDLLLVGPSPGGGECGSGLPCAIDGANGPSRVNMTVLRSNGASFDPLVLDVPISDFGQSLAADGTVLAGYGPRMTRLGDFNGDGYFDIVTTEEHSAADVATRQLVVYQQVPREPDVVTHFDGGPHVPAVTVDYDYAGPSSPKLYSSGEQCVYPQLCMRHLGWVVTAHHVEATGFEQITPVSNSFSHSYEDARADRSGRGFLGVRKHTRTDVTETTEPTEPNGTSQVETFDITSTVTASGTSALRRFAYSHGNGVSTETATPLPPRGSRLTGVSSNVSMVESGGVYRVQRRQDLTTEYDRDGLLVRSQRTTRQMDSFGSTTGAKAEESKGLLDFGVGPPPFPDVSTSTAWAFMSCTNPSGCSDEGTWLLSRYPGIVRTSIEPGLVETRTTAFTYEVASVEAKTITIEPNGPTESPSTSGTRRMVTLSRDSFGNVLGVEDVGSGPPRVSRTEYDGAENLYPVRDVDAEGLTTRRYYHAGLGVLVASDDAAGIRTQVEYDALLRPRVLQTGVRASNGLIGGHREEWSYASDNQALPLAATSPLRTMTVLHTSEISGPEKTQLDPTGRVLRSTVMGLHWNAFQTFDYDRFGRPKRATLPATTLSSLSPYNEYSYDLLGRLLTSSRPGEAPHAPRLTTTFSYEGRKTTQVRERSVATRAVVDAKGRMIEHSIKDPQSGREVVTKYRYGPFDVLLAVEHPPLDAASLMNPPPATATLTTRMVYDVLGRRQALNDPDIGAVQFLYNAFGEVKRKTDGTSSFTQYTYDKLGRPKTVVAPASAAYPSPRPNGDALNTTYVWDAVVPGKLSSVTSGDKIDVQFGYDAFARPETTTWTMGGAGSLGSFRFRAAYDSVGRLYTLAYPGPSANRPFRIRYGYAANGEVETISDASSLHSLLRPGQEEPQLWKQVSRNAAGLSTEEQFGTTESVHRIFDTLNQVRIIQGTFTGSGTTFQHLAYQWGADGFVTARTDLELGLAESFKHDFLGRVTEWTVNQNCSKEATWKYAYDDWGNLRARTRFEGAAQVESIINKYTSLLDETRPHAVKQLSETITKAFATSTITTSYDYDDAGNMKSGRDTTFTWTPFGLPRKMEKVAANAASTFRYDGSGARVLETQTDLAGKQLRDIVTLGGLYERRTSQGREEHTFNVMSPNGIVAQVRRTVVANGGTETLQFIHSDHLGSTDVVTDSAGNVVDRAKYEPFGERRFPWAVAQTMAQAQPASASLGFTGQQPDNAFGLVNMRGRIYDPKIGRFVSPDPLSSAHSQGLSRYSYVRNSPLMLIDPTGFATEESGDKTWALTPALEPLEPEDLEDKEGAPGRKPLVHRSSAVDEGARTSDPSTGDGEDTGVAAAKGRHGNIGREFAGDTGRVVEVASEFHPLFALGMAWSGKHALGSDASNAERAIGAGSVVGPWLGRGLKFLGGAAGRLASFFRGGSAEAKLLSRAEGVGAGVAGGGKLLWGFWGDYSKVSLAGREYAEIGGRLYTQHAIERMLPSGLGAPLGALGAGRSIAPAFVEEAIATGSPNTQMVGGVTRTIFTSGDLQVVTEEGGRIVITVIPGGP